MTDPDPRPASPVPLRPLGFGDVLDGAFKVLRAEWRALAVAAGVLIVPLQLASSYVQRETLGQGVQDFLAGLDPEAGAPVADEAVVMSLIGGAVALLVVYPLLVGALTRVSAGALLGEPAGAGEALRTGLRRWLPLLVAWLLTLLLMSIPFAASAGVAVAGAVGQSPAFVVVGIVAVLLSMPVSAFVLSFFVAAPSVIVVEGAGPLRGLGRSAALLRPRIFPVFGVLVVAGLLAGVISMVLSMIPSLLGMLAGETFGWLVVSVGGILANLVTLPFLVSVLVLLYVDGRVRGEGLDLEVAADRLDGG